MVKSVQERKRPTRGALDIRIRSDEGAPTPPEELLKSDAKP